MSSDDQKNDVENDDCNVKSINESNVESSGDHSVPLSEARPKEVGGRGGLEPTRYGDWEKSGRCIDF